MPLNPARLASSKVAPTTGGLFQLPSVSTASSVLPTFQPGFMREKNVPAEMEVNLEVEGQVMPVLFAVKLVSKWVDDAVVAVVVVVVVVVVVKDHTLSNGNAAVEQQCCTCARDPHFDCDMFSVNWVAP